MQLNVLGGVVHVGTTVNDNGRLPKVAEVSRCHGTTNAHGNPPTFAYRSQLNDLIRSTIVVVVLS